MEKSTGAKIMVIGDDSNFCYLIRRFARQSSHEVAFAYSHEDAFALARRENFSAVIIEVDVTRSNGWSLLQALKSDEVTGSIPVILCSWIDNVEDFRSRDLKPDVHLKKPILYEDFVTALNHIGIQPVDQQIDGYPGG